MSAEKLNDRLVKAVMSADRAGVRTAIKMGADPSTKIEECVPVLFFAAAKAQVGIVCELIEAGADIHAKDYKNNLVLQYLASLPLTSQHDPVIKCIISAGANPAQSGDHMHWPLETALLYGNYSAAKLMVAGGATLEGTSRNHLKSLNMLRNSPTL